MTTFQFPPVLRTPKPRPVTAKPQTYTDTFRPATNILRTADDYVLELIVPGFSREDLEIQVDGDLLVVSSNLEVTREGKFQRKEFTPGRFRRRFRIPEDVDADRIEATQENGILRIQLPKAEAAKPRAIKVA